MTNNTILGIDVSKTRLDLASRPEGRTAQFPNSDDGVAACLAWVTPVAPSLIVIEATGGLERRMVTALALAQQPVAVINPRQAHDFANATGRLANTDALDADLLAHFGEAIRPQPRPLASEAQQQLDALVLRQRQLIEMRTMERNRLASASHLRTSLTRHLTWLTTEVDALDQQIHALLEASPVWQASADLLQSVPGVGPRLTAMLLARLPELGTLDRRRVAALVGVAPFNRDSGTFRGRRSVWGGRSDVRAVLYMGTLSAIRWNPVIQPYYQRLRDSGKVAKVAITACMRKLLTILNAMLQHKTPWKADFGKKFPSTS